METTKKNWDATSIKPVGCLKFSTIKKPSEQDMGLFVRLLEAADKKDPWVTEGKPKHSVLVTQQHKSKSSRSVVFRINPWYTIQPRQLYAFYRYLCNLADEVTKQDPKNLTFVSVSLELETDFYRFPTSKGKEILEEMRSVMTERFLDALD